ncbi:thymidine kinase [Brevibacillus reuszeri]|uniref:Thymidine kinase n=1 Tax=Brevibacillus reuszeri TaxID=54915 RepID=A0A0K9YUU1_9BACL|nr:thymidine kinase [Brevibacillus reuszeri]KNB71955.1 thymidine kinase [Brevibacillus reuszeri]MED1859178.1 thymidine kinase [Brevibacillus reuszeri]
MTKLIFKYGQMSASKSLQLLTSAHNYEDSGKKVMIFTPALDDRFGVGRVTSRVGISREAIPIHGDTDIYSLVEQNLPSCVLIDEAQFLESKHVNQLANIVDWLNIPVICYGLLKDFRNQLFLGSQALICAADKIEEIKTVCSYCTRKATHILKFNDGKPVYSGKVVEIGLNDKYKSVCRIHYHRIPTQGE